MNAMECEAEVCAYERDFHEAIREYLLVTFLFGLLYFGCSLLVRRFRRPPQIESLEADASDHSVIRISLWLCTFSLAVSCAAVLLLPVSVLVNEIISREAFAHNYYLRWLNGGLIRMLWKCVSFCTNLCLFVLLPFAYFFSEAEGLSIRSLSFFPLLNPSSLLRRGRDSPGPGLRPRVCEALLLVCFLAVAVCGLIWVASHYPMLAVLFAAPLDAKPAPASPPSSHSFISFATSILLFRVDDPPTPLLSPSAIDPDDSWKTLFDFWNFHLPRLYSFVSAFGAIAALFCMPAGFVKIFTLLKDLLNKPADRPNRAAAAAAPRQQSETLTRADPSETLEAVRLKQHALERKLHSCRTCAARNTRLTGLDSQLLADDTASLLQRPAPGPSAPSSSVITSTSTSQSNGFCNGSATPAPANILYRSNNSHTPFTSSSRVNGGSKQLIISPLIDRARRGDQTAQAAAPDSPIASASPTAALALSLDSCSSLWGRLFARRRTNSQSDCVPNRPTARTAPSTPKPGSMSSSATDSTLSRVKSRFANGFSTFPLSVSMHFSSLSLSKFNGDAVDKNSKSSNAPPPPAAKASSLYRTPSTTTGNSMAQAAAAPMPAPAPVPVPVSHRKCAPRSAAPNSNSVCAQCAHCKSLVKQLDAVKEQLDDLERRFGLSAEKAPSRCSAMLRLAFHIALQLIALSLTALTCVLIVLQLVSLVMGYRTVVSASADGQKPLQQASSGLELELGLELGPGSRSSFGLLGALLEVALLVYLLVAHLAGFYGNRVGARLLPRAHATSLTQMLAHSWVLLVLTAVLPIQARMLGITHFSLLGHFAHVRWLRDLRLVLLYDTVFAFFTFLALCTPVARHIRRELMSALAHLVAEVRAFSQRPLPLGIGRLLGLLRL